MLNRAPIFLNCFSRGGSNMLWNLFLTHPDLASPIQETLVIFRAGLRGTLDGNLLVLLSRQLGIMNQWRLEPRAPLTAAAANHLDRVFWQWKLRTFSDVDMRFKYEDVPYTLAEVERTRLVAKHNNGLAFLAAPLRRIYPDSTFFALVRDPVALWESHKRRKIARSPREFTEFYNTIARRMLSDARELSAYHVIRFEDMVADPVSMMRRLHELVGADAGKVRKIRLAAKEHWHRDGTHHTPYQRGRHYWFEPHELDRILERDINELQADRVGREERALVLGETAAVRSELGYEPVAA